MTNQLSGIQITPKVGSDFNTQYNVPTDNNLTNQTTMPNNAVYNFFMVLFEGKQTENVPQFANSNIFQDNGLKKNFEVSEVSKFNAIG